MAWIKVPPENHPRFLAALPEDARVETRKMFGGIAAKVNDRIFAGLFGRSVMLLLPEDLRAQALALEGAAYFDPMGNGRVCSQKIMLPERMMESPAELKRWIRRAFDAATGAPIASEPKTRRAPAKAKRARTSTPTAAKPKARTSRR